MTSFIVGVRSWLFKAPKNIQQNEYPKYLGIFHSALFGIIVNVMLLLALASQGHALITLMSASAVIFWSLVVYFVRRARYSAAISLGVFEIMFHAGSATVLIGTVYGAQLILWTGVAYSLFGLREKPKLTVFIAYCILLELALLYTFVPHKTVSLAYDAFIVPIFVVLVLSSGIPLVSVLLSIKTTQLKLRKSLLFQANHDSLTKLYNRGFFDNLLEYDRNTLTSGGGPFCICLGDVDHFKRINDEFGHDVGDEVLIEIAERLKSKLRASDAVCRWGGEEFAIILRRCAIEDAQMVIQQIRKIMCDQPMSSQGLEVTMSFGLIQATHNENSDSLIKRADELLYQAKHQGRNKVVAQTH